MVAFHASCARRYVPYMLNGRRKPNQNERTVSRNAPTHGGMMRTARARSKKKYPEKTTIAGKANKRKSDDAMAECVSTRTRYRTKVYAACAIARATIPQISGTTLIRRGEESVVLTI